MNHDARLQDDIAFDDFHGLLPDLPPVPDYIQEREMEVFREKYNIGENDGKDNESRID